RPRPCRFISWKIIFPMVPRSFKKAIIARHAWPAPRNHPVIRWTLAMRLINAAARLPAAPIPPVKLLRAFRDAAPNRTTAAATGASQAPTRRIRMADWWRIALNDPNAWVRNALARRVATLPIACPIRANPLDIESMIGRTVVNALRKAGRRPLLALSINRSIEGPRIRRNCLSIMALDAIRINSAAPAVNAKPGPAARAPKRGPSAAPADTSALNPWVRTPTAAPESVRTL